MNNFMKFTNNGGYPSLGNMGEGGGGGQSPLFGGATTSPIQPNQYGQGQQFGGQQNFGQQPMNRQQYLQGFQNQGGQRPMSARDRYMQGGMMQRLMRRRRPRSLRDLWGGNQWS